MNRTPIHKHTHKGKLLIPPMANINGTNLSWMNERLPEMLWACLIVAFCGRDSALNSFKKLSLYVARHPCRKELSDITLTGISKLDNSLREEIISFIVQIPNSGKALAPLLLFDSLPAREVWEKLLPKVSPEVEILMSAVAITLWHQSQEATDCRWIKSLVAVIAGKIEIPENMLREFIDYPNRGDQTRVRPSIRALELAISSTTSQNIEWPKSFWATALRNTHCLELIKKQKHKIEPDNVTISAINDIRNLLLDHWGATCNTTGVDSKHDTIFGLTFYALRILSELCGIGVGNGILGRLGIRTILEIHITLRYLLKSGNSELWNNWRRHGAGQAKLNVLKFSEGLETPKFLSFETIEQIANEDIWEEFLEINLARWDGLDLRKMSEKVGLKSIYDQYYSWTSGYSHGSWGAVRESCFVTCANPLHRLHRFPKVIPLGDTLSDATRLVNNIIGDLEDNYPNFNHRIKI